MSRFTVILLASLLVFASARQFNQPDGDHFIRDGRIINGEDAAIGQFPHQVSLRFDGSNNDHHYCGGTIIGSRWILTAAHCSDRSESLVAVVGTVELSAEYKAYQISQKIVHPRWSNSPQNLRNDIAMWRTAEDIEFNAFVQPASLPTQNTEEDEILTVSGWGDTFVSVDVD